MDPKDRFAGIGVVRGAVRVLKRAEVEHTRLREVRLARVALRVVVEPNVDLNWEGLQERRVVAEAEVVRRAPTPEAHVDSEEVASCLLAEGNVRNVLTRWRGYSATRHVFAGVLWEFIPNRGCHPAHHGSG